MRTSHHNNHGIGTDMPNNGNLSLVINVCQTNYSRYTVNWETCNGRLLFHAEITTVKHLLCWEKGTIKTNIGHELLSHQCMNVSEVYC